MNLIRIGDHVINLDQVTKVTLGEDHVRFSYSDGGTWVFAGDEAAALRRYFGTSSVVDLRSNRVTTAARASLEANPVAAVLGPQSDGSLICMACVRAAHRKAVGR